MALRKLLNSGPRTSRARPTSLSPQKADDSAPAQATGPGEAARLLDLLQDRDGLAQAKPLLEAELKSRENAPDKGKDHPDTLLSVTCLAMLLQAQGNHEEAEPLYRRAMVGFEKKYGPNHRDTLISVNNLAVLLKSMKKLTEARPLYERVLKGDEDQLGPDHPHTLDSIYNLARLLQAEGKVDDALPLFKKELAGFDKHYGAKHGETRTSAQNLIALLLETGKQDEAAEIKKKYDLS